MKTIFAVFVFGFAATASAQEYRLEVAQAGIAAQAAAARGAAQSAKDRAHALEAAITAMNDGPEAGGAVIAALDDAKLGRLDVGFATQSEAVTTGLLNGRPAILLSDALPAHPRVYAPLIAFAASKEMFAGMPACAEREYMRSALAARVFSELGGEFGKLPVVDGDKAEAVASAVKAWAKDAQTALYEAGVSSKLPDLPELQSRAKDPKTAAELDAANRRFTAFLFNEREARASAR